MLMTAKQRRMNEALDKERAEIVSRLDRTEQRLNGTKKTMTCPICGRRITVPLEAPFKCDCGWPKANGKGGS